ncbi:MAG: patatin-like phospholipase family protein [Actinobacteria bacterium]|nr:patatin-like phospholipase family protein [Actinomycetota bacterium]
MSFWRKPKKIGVALSGGGARGLAHIGVLEVLENEGIHISAISGTSMGSVVGALYCAGFSIKEMLEFMESNDWKRFIISTNFTLPGLPALNSRRVSKLLYKFLADKTFEDCSKSFCAVAADIVSKKKVFITKGKLSDAIKASIAIPGVFEHVVKDGMILVDGGVIDPVPIDAIRKMGVDFVIGVALNNIDSNEIPNSKTSIFNIINIALSMMEREIETQHFNKADIVIQPKTADFGIFDFKKASEIIEAGRVEARKYINEIKKKLY